MEAYKKEFIEFMVESHVLKFGEFTLKSGRKSPFFMNAGAYVTGGQLKRLGEYYARAIHDNFGLDFDVVFGPAYKGIPLAVVQEKYGFPVASIVSMAEVTELLYNHEVQGEVVIDDTLKAALDAYYEQYGAKEA